jgi:hypothetical protein
MVEGTNGSLAIQSGTAEGLLQFLDWVVAKGYGPATAAGPQKSAVTRVLTVTEGDDFGSLDVKSLDLDDLLSRFEVRALGDLKAESIGAYRNRFTRAVEAYREFLNSGKPPSYRPSGRHRPAASGAPNKGRVVPSTPPVQPAHQGSSERMVDYPFPLKSGALANFRLPVRLEREDAERMGAFIRTLVFEPQKELSRGNDGGAEE